LLFVSDSDREDEEHQRSLLFGVIRTKTQPFAFSILHLLLKSLCPSINSENMRLIVNPQDSRSCSSTTSSCHSGNNDIDDDTQTINLANVPHI